MICRKCKMEAPNGKYCALCGAEQEIRTVGKSRGNGQGTAVKRGKSWAAVWTQEVYLDPESGKMKTKRRWKSGFRTKTAALAYAAAPPEKEQKPVPTLRDYWTAWEKSDYLDLSDSKRGAARIAWKKLGSLAGRRMDTLTIQDLQDCVDAKASTYYPAKDMRTLLSHLFDRAVAEGNARTNLARFVRLPGLEEEEGEPFTEEELHALWDAYGKEQDRVIGLILLMIYTGMMPGEMLKLKADMIDWDRREIIGGGIKTKKRKQTPMVFPELIQPVLEALVESSPSRIGYVAGVNKDKFYKLYHQATVSAGVRDLPPYSCRHTTATALALGNIAPSVIQEVMRHAKFSTTQRYIHPDMGSAHAAINSLDKGKPQEDANNGANNTS